MNQERELKLDAVEKMKSEQQRANSLEAEVVSVREELVLCGGLALLD